MAFTTDTVTSLSNLVDKLDIWMAANGWTSEHKDLLTTVGTGGEWAMRRTSGATNLRFSASWDAAGTPTKLALYQYVDQNYVIGNRPWGQHNDSGNGLMATTPDSSISNERHVILTGTPIRFWAFEGDHYTYIVVKTTADEYAHFGFGLLDKQGGDWTGGEFVYGQRNSGTSGNSQAVRDDRTHLLDGYFNDTGDTGGLSNNSELIAATIHCESLPNQPTNGQWAVSMGGKAASPQTDFGFDRQSNDGSSSDIARVNFTWGLRSGPWAATYYRAHGADQTGEVRFWPIGMTYVDDSTGDLHGVPIGWMPEAFGCSLAQYTGEDILLDDDSKQYYIFPAYKRWPSSGPETGTSGYLGVAYRIP